MTLRYDIGGELAGIKGLVPRSVIVRKGLSDYYVAVYPKVYNITKTITVAEAEIAYLSNVYKNLDGNEKLALAALLTTSRLKSEVGDPRILLELNPEEYITATLKLYKLANDNIEPEEIIIRKKIVTYTWIIWTAIPISVVIQVTTTMYTIIGRGTNENIEDNVNLSGYRN